MLQSTRSYSHETGGVITGSYGKGVCCGCGRYAPTVIWWTRQAHHLEFCLLARLSYVEGNAAARQRHGGRSYSSALVATRALVEQEEEDGIHGNFQN